MASLVQLSAEQQGLAERARRFVDDVLKPHEVAAERAGGRLPDEMVARIRAAALAAGLAGGRHAVAHGGQDWSAVDYVVVHELCHLRVPNHSRAFWALVEGHRPHWRQQRDWLRDHGPELLAFRPQV